MLLDDLDSRQNIPSKVRERYQLIFLQEKSTIVHFWPWLQDNVQELMKDLGYFFSKCNAFPSLPSVIEDSIFSLSAVTQSCVNKLL